MIEVENLTKRFGVKTVVDNISFKAKLGQVVGFLGPNGAGKSTTMKMLTGYLAPSSGQIKILGKDIAVDPILIKKNIGYLPEGCPAYTDMTAYKFLNFIAEIRGFRGEQKWQRLREIISKFKLSSILGQPIETLSKGFKRRVGLAQAIMHDPRILILDEPTDGLDPNQKHDMREFILELAKDKIIILSTHILEEVESVCDRAIVIAEGKIVADSTPLGLAARGPKHNTVELTVTKIEGADICEALADIPGVAKIELVEDTPLVQRVCIYPESSGISVSQIHHLAYQQDWELLDIQTQTGQLEDVFRLITKQCVGAN